MQEPGGLTIEQREWLHKVDNGWLSAILAITCDSESATLGDLVATTSKLGFALR